MDISDPRATIERLCRERGEDFAGLSRLIGRNAAYVQQFVRRGTPRRLDDRDRATLARYFGIGEEALGGPPPGLAPQALRSVPLLDIGASAGPGGVVDEEGPTGAIAFDDRYLRAMVGGDPAGLSLIRVSGDSMTPTLRDGDTIMVDRGDGADRLRDGIYVLRRDDALVVKRLRIDAATAAITIVSDNPAWPDEPVVARGALAPVGRVVWSAGPIP